MSGGGTGIGRAVAAGLLADGLDVVLLGGRPEVLDRAVAALATDLRDGHVTALRCDVAEPADVQRCAAVLATQHPVVDVIVANAGPRRPACLRRHR